MSNDLLDSELRLELEGINGRLADPAARLAADLTSGVGRRILGFVWAGVQPGRNTAARLRASAKAFVSIIDRHPAGTGKPLSRVGIPIFPDQAGFSPMASRDAGQILTFGSLYLGVLGLSEGPRSDRLWDIMVGADVVNTLLRDALTNKPFGPDPRVPPDLFDIVQDFAERNCLAGVGRAMNDVGRVLQTWRSRSHADGITRIDPPQGCGGDVVTIRGTGFGTSQPPDTDIYFPTRSGGCNVAQVVRPNGWNDTAIKVIVPADVGTGCVGFVVHGSGGVKTIGPAVDTLVGEVTSCLGPIAAEQIRATYEKVVNGALKAPCPPCLPRDANGFTGGPPVIQFLGKRIRDTTTSVSTLADLQPGDMLELSWNVNNATQMQIVPVAINGQLHELHPLTGPFPAQGSRLIEWLPHNPLAYATFSWDAAYELRATNCCGPTIARITIRMRLPAKAPPAPGDFLWGVATAGRQVEGHNTGDDWQIFTTDPDILQRLQTFKKNHQELKINPQDAGGALNHWAWGQFSQSVERARALGLNAYRFSIEWSRIEPVSGRFDTTALGNYQMMIAAVRGHGMEPIAVLNHLSLPAWVQTPPRQSVNTCCDPGAYDGDPDYQNSLKGWETTDTVDAYVRYVEFVVTSLAGVRMWITFNEPLMTTVPTGYLASVFPPGFLGDGGKAKDVIHNLITAHARAYERIHAIAPGAQVGITDQWLFCKDVLDPNATKQFVYYHQDFLINALVHGDEDRDISVTSPKAERVLGIAAADWTPHLDFFGLQYYKSVYPYHFVPLASRAPWFGARADLDLTSAKYAHLLLNDMGWEIDPEGLYYCLMKLKKIAKFNMQDLPILLAENGTAESVDHNRSAYLTSHVQQLQRAERDGATVIGYLHWSISDNWEWIDGYRQEARFGLFAVDLPSNAPVHTITDGALALAYTVARPPISVDLAIDRYGRYRPDGAVVEHPVMSPCSTWQGTFDGRPITLLLGALGNAPVPLPGLQTNLVGMLFYVEERRWLRLDEVLWDGSTRTLQFMYRGFAVGGPVRERLFAGVLDAAGNTFAGLATESSGNMLFARKWQVTREPLAGMWQGNVSPRALITLSLSCPEGDWRGRVLRAMDWRPLASINVNPTGFIATESGTAVDGSFGAGSLAGFTGLVVSPWGVGMRRLPDGLPF